jgi:ankyrin repeat protein
VCGYKKLDGFVFCLGIDCLAVSYHTHPHIQNLVYSSSYLIREAIFRPEYSLGSSGRNFLSICPLGALVDMYHAHEATKRHDKVYALLGMSSDDLSEAGLLPNYARPWEDVFQQLVRHLIPKSRSIQTWANKEIAVFQSPGYVLGMVKAVSINTDRGDRYRVEVSSIMHIPEQLQQVFKNGYTWTIQASAKTIREGDFICIFKGASRPSIIRSQKDYFTVIMVAVPFSDEREMEHDPIEWSMLSLSSRFPSRNFLLVWNWEESPRENTDLSEDTDLEENTNTEKDTDPEEYETWLQRNEDTGELSKLDTTYDLARATRAWNAMLILGDTATEWVFMSQMNNRNRKQADKHGRDSMRSFDIAMRKAWPLAPECRSNQTSLDCAKREHYRTIVNLLHEFYRLTLDPYDKDYGPLPLLWAAQGGYEAVIKVLLDVRNIDLNVMDQNGRTPLWWAADKGHEAVVQLLLATGKVDIKLHDSRSRNTPLHCAALRGHGGVVQLLLDTGVVDVDLKNGGRKQTPLLLAAKEGHESVLRLLLETGRVDINATDRNMLTPLWWAADRGHSTIVQMLLDTGKLNVDPEAITTTRGISFGSTPLHCAARSGHSVVVQLLLETGKVDVNYEGGREQQTPLSIAAENGHEDVVAMLLRVSNVKLNLRNEYSYSPLQLAARNGHERVVKLLLGADNIQIDEKNWRGETPLSLATDYGHDSVVQLLVDFRNNHIQLLEQPASGEYEGVAEPL